MKTEHDTTHAGAWRRRWAHQMALVVSSWVIAFLVATAGRVVAQPVPAGPVEPVEMDAPVRVLAEPQPVAGISVELGRRTLDALRPHGLVRVKDFPLEQGKRVDLELEQFAVTTGATQFMLGTDGGDKSVGHPDVALFRGRVVNEPQSQVFLGISAAKSNGFITMPGKEYILAPSRSGKRTKDGVEHVVYERFAAGANAPPSPFQCQTRTAREPEGDPGAQATVAMGGYPFRIALVALECDYEYGQSFDSMDDAFIYTIELLGAISSVYERDLQVRLYIPYLRIWSTSSDPYVGNDVAILLPQFESYWRANMGSVGRDIAHFLTSKSANGGLAEVDVLCNEQWGYGTSSGISGVFPRPLVDGSLEQWDVYVVAHEMGHQFGSPHTHCYNPPIDNCGQSFDDCWNGIYACQQGTIMSYCKSCPGGLANVDIRFHDRVITRIRQSVDASCLRSGLNPVYVDAAYVGLEFGTQSYPFNTATEGIRVVIPWGTVYFDAGLYPEWIRESRPMVLRTTGGAVVIGP